MSGERKDLRALIASVQLREVRLVRSSSATSIASPQEAPKAELEVAWTTRARKAADGQFVVAADVRATLRQAGTAQTKPAIQVEATYELTYCLPVDFKPTQKLLGEFADVNGVYNAWPYWREFIQSTVARMGLPPIVLPVLRAEVARGGSLTGKLVVEDVRAES